MSRIIEEGKRSPQKIEFMMGRIKFVLDVMSVCYVQVMGDRNGNKLVSVEMECSAIDRKPYNVVDIQPCDSDFMEDVKALAKQYGYELIDIKVK